MRAVPVDRGQARRRLRDRAFIRPVMFIVGILALGIVLVPFVTRQSFGPRSSAALALVVFGGLLAAEVIRRRVAWRRDDRDTDGDR